MLVQVLSEHLNVKESNALGSQNQVQYLTRVEASKLLQISLPTLNDYTKRGIISSYRIGSNVRYKSSDIESALQERCYSPNRKGVRHA
ncbi:helix-turn-helix domain-containing protein [Rufibacter roseus]|uniref:Helix-turn-helix domain-containing protein n=2 Tax=Rufibacter roseus TaxID=1567108 RepID=A0ABW2DRN3_9BACT